MSLVIEPFFEDDVLPLVRMWRSSFEHGVGIADPHPITEQVAYLLEEVAPRHTVRVAKSEGTVVGLLASNGESIAALYVAVSHLGRGIGSTLLDIAKEHSAGTLWLHTFARNVNARRFYAKHGFTEVAHGVEPHWQLEDVRLEWTRPDAT